MRYWYKYLVYISLIFLAITLYKANFLKIPQVFSVPSFIISFILLFAQNDFDSPDLSILLKPLFILISLICGFLTASQFPLANKLYLRGDTNISKTAGLLYATDLMGGWLGGIAGAVVLLPVLGLIGTIITVGILKLSSFIVIITQPS